MNNRIAIIGCGVAGMTAAIYLKRAGLDVFILEKSMPGGQIVDNGHILNYPGFEEIDGSDLALKILKQVQDLDINVIYEEVTKIDDVGSYKKVITNKNEYKVGKIIIATGRKPRKLGVKGEDKYNTKGISYCAVCDGSLYKNKKLLIVGGSDGAFEAAKYLNKLTDNITILYRREIKAKKYLQDEVKNKVTIKKGEVLEFSKEDEKLMVRTSDDTLTVDGVFIYIGQIPNASFVKDLGILDDFGYVKVDSHFESDIKGIYAIGDAIKKDFYQIVIAMGEAAECALQIVRGNSGE
ncbi:MAG TPA: NAD(P)/FAD-dependent oxidoreductase [Candidatus Onthousia faecavium]|mgnify:CR=1 FL=1|nr:NAD(P)/FAD-dependent oxidoreductase [Candidatus Onthousia faecavium]